MILEYLQPDPSMWDALMVVARAGYTLATVGAAGSALFATGFLHRLLPDEAARLRRLVAWAASLGLLLSVTALGLRVVVLTAGASATDGAVWAAVLRSRIGDAFWLRAAGLTLLLLALGAAAPARWGAARLAAGAVGAALALASYAAMGHSMLYGPRQEIAVLVLVHLAVVAFWAGSLPPLLWVAWRPHAASAGALVADWSRAAAVAVALMLASGAMLTWYLTVRLDRLLDTWHGWALLAKVLLASGALALAVLNKARHTPALRLSKPEAGAGLARSIRWEIALVALALYAAAELTSVHPTDYGHRVTE